MADKTNLATGAAMMLAGAGEIVATQSICPLCIGAITGGAALIAGELGLKIKK